MARLLVVRRIPIDWQDVVRVTGLRKGKLCKTKCWGWGIQNTAGLPGPHFAGYDPPPMQPGEVDVYIKGNDWCFMAPTTKGAMQ